MWGKTTAVFLTSEEGGMGFTQSSNKYNNTSSYKQENYNAILFFLRLINNFLSSLQAECFYFVGCRNFHYSKKQEKAF